MSSRERWTVYPLLFLAIGLAVRAAALVDHPPDTVSVDGLDAGQVSCRELLVTARDGTVLVHVGSVVGGGGGIVVKDAAGVDSIAIGRRAESRDGVIQFFDEQGQPRDWPETAPAGSDAGDSDASEPDADAPSSLAPAAGERSP